MSSSEITTSANRLAWQAQVPDIVEELSKRWGLTRIGPPFTGGSVSQVFPVRHVDRDAVLKIQFIHEECLYEADALQRWQGNGAIHLIEHDRSLGALLVEVCSPGISLAQSNIEDKLGIIIDLLPKLWIQAGSPFKTLEQEAREWQMNLSTDWQAAGQPRPQAVLSTVLGYFDELLSTKNNHANLPYQQPLVLVNQDLHGDNILSAEREPWLVIDPKPLIGEKEFSIASVVRSAELGHSKEAVLYRLNRLCADLNLNKDRARKWSIVQTFAWGLGHPQMLEVVDWLLEDQGKSAPNTA